MSGVIAYFIHGWSGWGDNLFFPEVRKHLEILGAKAFSPDLPNPKKPTYPEWSEAFSKLIKETWNGERIIFCTHSMGGYFILRFISYHINEDWVKSIHGLCLVGPSSIKRPEYMPMYDEDLQLEKVAELPIQVHVLYSLDDPRIVMAHIDLLRNNLGKMSGFHYHEMNGFKHFQVKDVPEATRVCEDMAKEVLSL